MHTKLDIKIRGAVGVDDLKLIEGNLKSQSGINTIRAMLTKGQAIIRIEFDSKKISQQQIYAIIKLSGDFSVEEQSETDTIHSKELERAPLKSVMSLPAMVNYGSEANPNRAPFIWGLLCGISIGLNIIFGFLLMTGGANNLLATNLFAKTNGQVVQQAVQPQAVAPSPSQDAGVIQTFNITKSDHVRGDFNAPVTLVEYSDFQCPFCGKHFPTLNKVLSDYTGKVRLVYKHFPLGFHENAQKAAEASECANEQNKFWEYHDKLFENQASGFSLANFKQWANDLSLNASKFNDCLDSGKYASKVQADATDGQSRGVQGTPTTFVNGQAVSGAVPYESLKAVIDQVLNN